MAKTHPSLDDPNAFVLYRYHPSLAAAIIFIVLFAITTIIHIVQAVRSRARFLIPFIIGGICKLLHQITSPSRSGYNMLTRICGLQSRS